jgi:hypothetical protein
VQRLYGHGKQRRTRLQHHPAERRLEVTSQLLDTISIDCVYRSSDGMLVGIVFSDELHKFCNDTSYYEWAGVPPPAGPM